MIDRQTYLCLQDVIRREGRSFLQYTGESFPWARDGDFAAMVTLRRLIQEEREGAAALSRFLQKNRLTPPYLGAYPSYFTSYNYLSLDRLLPLLIEHQKSGLEALEHDLAGIQDLEARKQVQHLVEMKKRHLKELETLVQPAAA